MNTTKIFGINSLTLYPIVTDDVTAYTLGEPIPLDGAKSLEVSFEVEEKALTGNEVIIETFCRIRKLTFSATFAKLGFKALEAVLNSTKTTTGAAFQSGSVPGYFQLVGKSEGTDSGVLELKLMKCKINSIPLKMSENDFSTFSLAGTGIFTKHKFLKGENTAPMIMEIIFEGEENAQS